MILSKKSILSFVIYFSFISAAFAIQADTEITKPTRLSVDSGFYRFSEKDIELLATYSGFNPETGQRFTHFEISDQMLGMIQRADDLILASFFLFDVIMPDGDPARDIAGEFTEALLKKKTENPDIKIVVIFDPINRSYNSRISPKVQELVDGGIDVFYSDLLSTKSANFLGPFQNGQKIMHGLDKLSFGMLDKTVSIVADSYLPIPNKLDPSGISFETILKGAALKANHRKLLITSSSYDYELLVSSSNPHNASSAHENYAIWMKDKIAEYVYMVLREDVRRSIEIDDVLWSEQGAGKQAVYLDTILPAIDYSKPDGSESTPVLVRFLTEKKIKDRILLMLKEVDHCDQVRIQMFYLSDLDIVEAIAEAGKRVDEPIRIILDPNNDAFGRKKDGTPNRQVAAYLMDKKDGEGSKIEIRWYNVHGEQNHAKIMSIVCEEAGKEKYQLITGSANWTGKNLNDINMESNVYCQNCKHLTAKFDKLFDMFWYNSDGMIYTLDYKGKYEKHAGMWKWTCGEKWGYVAW